MSEEQQPLSSADYFRGMGLVMKEWKEKMLSTTEDRLIRYYATKLNLALIDFKKKFRVDYSL